MSFSFINVLPMFQSYINKILAGKFNVIVIIYLDNILIYTENKKKKHVQAVC